MIISEEMPQLNIKTSSQAEKFVQPERIKTELKRLVPGCFVSEGVFQGDAPGVIHDMEWNHLDQIHRNFIHDAYHDAMRVVTGRDFALSLTRWKNWPIFIQVADVRLSSYLYYQFFNMFGLLHCHQVTRLAQVGEMVRFDIKWYTASHWIFKPLHSVFNRMLLRLQNKQFQEDLVIRERRQEMRKNGYSFKTDWPDFINSNSLTDNVIPPDLPSVRWMLSNFQLNKMTRQVMGTLDFYLVKRDEESVLIWPATCPHEGARMEEPRGCLSSLACGWHGRKFHPFELSVGKKWNFLNIQIYHRGDYIEAVQESLSKPCRQDCSVEISPIQTV